MGVRQQRCNRDNKPGRRAGLEICPPGGCVQMSRAEPVHSRLPAREMLIFRFELATWMMSAYKPRASIAIYANDGGCEFTLDVSRT